MTKETDGPTGEPDPKMTPESIESQQKKQFNKAYNSAFTQVKGLERYKQIVTTNDSAAYDSKYPHYRAERYIKDLLRIKLKMFSGIDISSNPVRFYATDLENPEQRGMRAVTYRQEAKNMDQAHDVISRIREELSGMVNSIHQERFDEEWNINKLDAKGVSLLDQFEDEINEIVVAKINHYLPEKKLKVYREQ